MVPHRCGHPYHSSVKAQTGHMQSMPPFGSASAWTLVVVEVIRLFGSLAMQKCCDIEETRLSEAITACVDTATALRGV